MKKILTLLSALFIVTGLKAQKSNAQKETVKPIADSMIKKPSINRQLNKQAIQQKGIKFVPVIKDAPAAKIAPISKKASKWASVQH